MEQKHRYPKIYHEIQLWLFKQKYGTFSTLLYDSLATILIKLDFGQPLGKKIYSKENIYTVYILPYIYTFKSCQNRVETNKVSILKFLVL